eukprot:Nk52_evm54s207 gene=Nk52_evmTU54s207
MRQRLMFSERRIFSLRARPRKSWRLFLFVVLLIGIFSSAAAAFSSDAHHYLVTFPLNYQEDAKGKGLSIVLTGEGGAQVHGMGERPLNETVELVDGHRTVINVPTTYELKGTYGISNNAIAVTCESPCKVYANSLMKYSSYSYLALDRNHWGKHYVVLSMPNEKFSEKGKEQMFVGSLTLTAQQEDTRIVVVPSCNVSLPQESPDFENGEIHITLHKGESYYVQAADFDGLDLSGTLILASEPVAAFTGHSCSSVQRGAYCSSFAKQLTPTSKCGSEFLMTPFVGGVNGFSLKIVSLESNTNLQFSRGIDHTIPQAMGSLFLEFDDNQPLMMNSSKPIIAMQFAKGLQKQEKLNKDKLGDTLPLLLIPTKYFAREYDVFRLAKWDTKVSLIIHNDAKNSLVVNGVALLIEWVPVGDGKSVYGNFSITDIRRNSGPDRTFKIKSSDDSRFFSSFYSWGSYRSHGNIAGVDYGDVSMPSTTPVLPSPTATPQKAPAFVASGSQYYFVTFPLNYVKESRNKKLRIVLTGEGKAQVHGMGERPLNETVELVGGHRTVINVPTTYELKGTYGISNNAIAVTCESPCKVYANSLMKYSSYSYLAVNRNHWGKHYVVLSMPNEQFSERGRDQMFVGSLTLVARHDDTTIVIVPSCTVALPQEPPDFENGEIHITLHKGESYYVQAADFDGLDLSGTLILASEPVAAFTGHSCSSVQRGAYCSSFAKQLTPASKCGNEFLMAPFVGGVNGFSLKIVSLESNTNLQFSRGVDHTIPQAMGSLFLEFDDNQPLMMNSSKPIIAMQFAKGLQKQEKRGKDKLGDSLPLLLVPIKYFARKYDVFRLGKWDTKVALIIDNEAKNNLVVNGVTPSIQWMPMGDGKTVYGNFSIADVKGNSGPGTTFQIKTYKGSRFLASFYSWGSYQSIGNVAGIDYDGDAQHYLITFPLNYIRDAPGKRLSIALTGEGKAQIHGMGEIAFSETLELVYNQTAVIKVPSAYESQKIYGVSTNTIAVSCQNPCSVFPNSVMKYSSYGYLAIDRNHWGRHYVVLSMPNENFSEDGVEQMFVGSLTLIAQHDSTRIVVIPSCNVSLPEESPDFEDGKLHITLNMGESYLIQAADFDGLDLSGTWISASEPVAAFTGHSCSSLQSESYCSSFAKQLTPTSKCGNAFLMAPFAGGAEGFFLKIVTLQSNTSVQLSPGIAHTIEHARGSLFMQFEDNQPLVMASSKPIIAMQFAKGIPKQERESTNKLGDILPLLLIPTKYFAREYDVFRLTTWDTKVAMIIGNEAKNSVVVNGITPTIEWMPIGDDENVYGNFSIADIRGNSSPNATFHINTNTGLRFFVSFYSWGPYRSIGSVAGLDYDVTTVQYPNAYLVQPVLLDVEAGVSTDFQIRIQGDGGVLVEQLADGDLVCSDSLTEGAVTVCVVPISSPVAQSVLVGEPLQVLCQYPCEMEVLYADDKQPYAYDVPAAGEEGMVVTGESGLVGVNGTTQVLLVSGEDQPSTVTITPSVPVKLGDVVLPAGVAYTFTPEQGEVYTLKPVTAGDDMSGTLVRSESPVTVLTTQPCALATGTVEPCGESVRPVELNRAYGYDYVAFPFAGRYSGYTTKIVATEAETSVMLHNGTIVVLPDAGSFVEVEHSQADGAARVRADRPIAVVQFSKPSASDFNMGPSMGSKGDVLMVELTGNQQQLAEYEASAYTGFTNHFTVVARKTAAVPVVMLDGGAQTGVQWNDVDADYVYASFEVAPKAGAAPYTVTVQGGAEFGLYAYGWKALASIGGTSVGRNDSVTAFDIPEIEHPHSFIVLPVLYDVEAGVENTQFKVRIEGTTGGVLVETLAGGDVICTKTLSQGAVTVCEVPITATNAQAVLVGDALQVHCEEACTVEGFYDDDQHPYVYSPVEEWVTVGESMLAMGDHSLAGADGTAPAYLVAADDTANVTVVPSVPVKIGTDVLAAGVPFTFSPVRGVTYTMEPVTAGDDMSGTRVVSPTQAVSVFASQPCALGQEPCGEAIIAVKPTRLLGYDYIGFPFAGRYSGYTTKVVATAADTRVQLMNGTIVVLPSVGSFVELDYSQGAATRIYADQRIAVLQYSKPSASDFSLGPAEGSKGDVLMVALTGKHQQLAQYAQPLFAGYQNYFTVVARVGGAQTVLLDNVSAPNVQWNAVDDEFVYASIPVTPKADGSPYSVSVGNGLPFALYVYGWKPLASVGQAVGHKMNATQPEVPTVQYPNAYLVQPVLLDVEAGVSTDFQIRIQGDGGVLVEQLADGDLVCSDSLTEGAVTVCVVPISSPVAQSVLVGEPLQVLCQYPCEMEVLYADDKQPYAYDVPAAGEEGMVVTGESGLVGVNGTTQVLLVSGEDQPSTVTITPSVPVKLGDVVLPAGVAYTFTPEQGEVYTLKPVTAGDDMSGTLVRSESPVTVLTTQPCALATGTVEPCGESVRPVELNRAYGYDYVAFPFAGRYSGYTTKIVATEAETSVMLHNGTIVVLPDAGSFVEVEHSQADGAARVRADRPIAVVQFSKPSASDFNMGPSMGSKGDVLMVELTGNQQQLAEYEASAYTGFTNHFTVVARKTAAVPVVMLDGGAQTGVQWNDVDADYVYASFEVAPKAGAAPYTVTVQGGAEFGLYAYGWKALASIGNSGIVNNDANLTVPQMELNGIKDHIYIVYPVIFNVELGLYTDIHVSITGYGHIRVARIASDSTICESYFYESKTFVCDIPVQSLGQSDVVRGSPAVVLCDNHCSVEVLYMGNTNAYNYLPLSTTSSGHEHIILNGNSKTLGTNGNSETTLITWYDSVNVTVSSSINYTLNDEASPYGKVLAFTAFKGIPYTLKAVNGNDDMTGTSIFASSPVSVFTLQPCIKSLPALTCAESVRQLLPVEYWAYEYVAFPFAARYSGFVVKIVASESSTFLKLNNGTIVNFEAQGSSLEIPYEHDKAVRLRANNPINVIQMSKASTSDLELGPFFGSKGDVLLLPLLGTQQWIEEYYAPTYPGFTTYATLVAYVSDLPGIIIDDTLIGEVEWVDVDGLFAYTSIHLPQREDGRGYSIHMNETQFGLYVYGWKEFGSIGRPANRGIDTPFLPPIFSVPVPTSTPASLSTLNVATTLLPSPTVISSTGVPPISSSEPSLPLPSGSSEAGYSSSVSFSSVISSLDTEDIASTLMPSLTLISSTGVPPISSSEPSLPLPSGSSEAGYPSSLSFSSVISSLGTEDITSTLMPSLTLISSTGVTPISSSEPSLPLPSGSSEAGYSSGLSFSSVISSLGAEDITSTLMPSSTLISSTGVPPISSSEPSLPLPSGSSEAGYSSSLSFSSVISSLGTEDITSTLMPSSTLISSTGVPPISSSEPSLPLPSGSSEVGYSSSLSFSSDISSLGTEDITSTLMPSSTLISSTGVPPISSSEPSLPLPSGSSEVGYSSSLSFSSDISSLGTEDITSTLMPSPTLFSSTGVPPISSSLTSLPFASYSSEAEYSSNSLSFSSMSSFNAEVTPTLIPTPTYASSVDMSPISTSIFSTSVPYSSHSPPPSTITEAGHYSVSFYSKTVGLNEELSLKLWIAGAGQVSIRGKLDQMNEEYDLDLTTFVLHNIPSSYGVNSADQISEKAITIDCPKGCDVVGWASIGNLTYTYHPENLAHQLSSPSFVVGLLPSGSSKTADDCSFLLISASEKTSITIKPAVKVIINGIVLDAFSEVTFEIFENEVALVKLLEDNESSGFNGTEVNATHPVSVFTGGSCVDIETSDCPWVFIPVLSTKPVDRLTYYVAPLINVTKGYTLSILALGDVLLELSNGTTVELVAPSSHLTLDVDGEQAIEIESSLPISVVLLVSLDNSTSLSTGIISLPIIRAEDFVDRQYVFPLAGFSSYITIVSQHGDVVLELDGVEQYAEWNRDPSTSFYYAHMELSPKNSVEATLLQSSSPVGIYEYGWNLYSVYAMSLPAYRHIAEMPSSTISLPSISSSPVSTSIAHTSTYYIAFPLSGLAFDDTLEIHITGNGQASVRSNDPSLLEMEIMDLNTDFSPAIVRLPESFTQVDTSMDPPVAIVECSDCVVKAVSLSNTLSYSYLAFAKDHGGKDFYAIGRPNGYGLEDSNLFIGRGHVIIISHSDQNAFSITSPCAMSFRGDTYPANIPFSSTLDREESVMLLCTSIGEDITGAHIISLREVTVINGHSCAASSSIEGSCSVIAEFLPAVEKWGYTYPLAPFKSRYGGYNVRVMARAENTVVSTSNGEVQSLSGPGSYIDLAIETNVGVVIYSDKPVLVIQNAKDTESDFFLGSTGAKGDSLHILVPSVSSYLPLFHVSPFVGFNNYVSVICESAKVESIAFSSGLGVDPWIKIENSLFSYKLFSFAQTDLVVQILSTSESPFMVFHYAFSDHDSIGQPANLYWESIAPSSASIATPTPTATAITTESSLAPTPEEGLTPHIMAYAGTHFILSVPEGADSPHILDIEICNLYTHNLATISQTSNVIEVQLVFEGCITQRVEVSDFASSNAPSKKIVEVGCVERCSVSVRGKIGNASLNNRVLPTNALGSVYRVVGGDSVENGPSTSVSIYSETDGKIFAIFPTSVKHNDTIFGPYTDIVFEAEKGNVYSFEGYGSEGTFSGSYVESNGTVGVEVFSYCSQTTSCISFSHSIPPLSQWGTSFAIGLTHGYSGRIKLVTSGSTDIQVNGNYLMSVEDEGAVIEVSMNSTLRMLVTTSLPCIVLLEVTEENSGRLSSLIVPPVEQWDNMYMVRSPDDSPTRLVIIGSQNIDLHIDITGAEITREWLPLLGTSLIWTEVDVLASTASLFHNPESEFIVFSYFSNNESFNSSVQSARRLPINGPEPEPIIVDDSGSPGEPPKTLFLLNRILDIGIRCHESFCLKSENHGESWEYLGQEAFNIVGISEKYGMMFARNRWSGTILKSQFSPVEWTEGSETFEDIQVEGEIQYPLYTFGEKTYNPNPEDIHWAESGAKWWATVEGVCCSPPHNYNIINVSEWDG